jgi:hypothetical protein
MRMKEPDPPGNIIRAENSKPSMSMHFYVGKLYPIRGVTSIRSFISTFGCTEEADVVICSKGCVTSSACQFKCQALKYSVAYTTYVGNVRGNLMFQRIAET